MDGAQRKVPKGPGNQEEEQKSLQFRELKAEESTVWPGNSLGLAETEGQTRPPAGY